MFDNASELSGYFYVKTIVLHNHSPEYRVLDHLSSTEKEIILLEREIKKLNEEINNCDKKIRELKNERSKRQWKITMKNKINAKKKKEEKLRGLRELPAIESEFHRYYGFDGYSEKNEVAYNNIYLTTVDKLVFFRVFYFTNNNRDIVYYFILLCISQ